MKALVFLVVGACAQSSVDCSDASPWEPKVYGAVTATGAPKVHHLGKKYTQSYWAGETDIPGTSGAWILDGDCASGTVGQGSGGPKADCIGASNWSASKEYTEAGARVVFNNKLFVNQWWAQGNIPESDPAWKSEGVCADGTLPEADSNAQVNPQFASDMCTCCTECVDATVLGPVCKELVQGKCYFIDCRTVNTFDEKACEATKAGNKHLYYQKEVKPLQGVWPKRVYAPYIDGGLSPFPRIAEIAKTKGVKFFTLAFVQSTQACFGSIAGTAIQQGPILWDDKQGRNVYMWEELNELRSIGGDVAISFGGANGIELADSPFCHTGDPVANLVKEYGRIIDYLKINVIDFDIEGMAVSSVNRQTGWKYRFEATKALVKAHPNLKVWWTLPILPQGLTLDGITFVGDLLAADAPMDIINVMNMDYGEACPGNVMGPCELSAMTNLAQQVFDLAKSAGKLPRFGWTSPADVYPWLGSTPMIGLNDVITLNYHVAEAVHNIQVFKTEKPIGLISQWSLARDGVCPAGVSYVDLNCSGAPDQTHQYQFAEVFNQYTSF